jgi:hypothetical protein
MKKMGQQDQNNSGQNQQFNMNYDPNNPFFMMNPMMQGNMGGFPQGMPEYFFNPYMMMGGMGGMGMDPNNPNMMMFNQQFDPNQGTSGNLDTNNLNLNMNNMNNNMKNLGNHNGNN